MFSIIKLLITSTLMLIFLFTSLGSAKAISAHGIVPGKDKFKQRLDSIQYLLSVYDTLSPFAEYENAFDRIVDVQSQISDKLIKVLSDPRIVKYNITELFGNTGLMISHSSDERIYFLSLDEKTGGSFRSCITIIHYRLPNGIFQASYFGDGDDDALSTSVYDTPYLLDSISNIYFVSGSVTTCNTCVAAVAITLQLDSAGYTTDVVYAYDGRYYDLLKFDFDTHTKTFTYEYYEPLADDPLYAEDDEQTLHQMRCIGLFAFEQGKFFEKSKCEYWEPREK